MKTRCSVDHTGKKAFHGEVNPATAKFKIPKQLLRRIIRNALVFIPLPFLALYFEQRATFWFSLIIGVGITAWQVLAYGILQRRF